MELKILKICDQQPQRLSQNGWIKKSRIPNNSLSADFEKKTIQTVDQVQNKQTLGLRSQEDDQRTSGRKTQNRYDKISEKFMIVHLLKMEVTKNDRILPKLLKFGEIWEKVHNFAVEGWPA